MSHCIRPGTGTSRTAANSVRPLGAGPLQCDMDPKQVVPDAQGVWRCTECGFPYNQSPHEVGAATASGVQAVQGALANIPENVRGRRPAPDVWSVNAYVGHLADVGELVTERVRRISTEDRPVLENQDQDRRVAEMGYDQVPADASMTRLVPAAEAFQRQMGSLPEGAWDRVGRHSVAGDVGLGQVAHDFPHELHHHAADIRRVGRQVGHDPVTESDRGASQS